MEIAFGGKTHAGNRHCRKAALALAVCALSLAAFAGELFNVAQTSLGATAVTTGAPVNKDWPGLRAIPKEDPVTCEAARFRRADGGRDACDIAHCAVRD